MEINSKQLSYLETNQKTISEIRANYSQFPPSFDPEINYQDEYWNIYMMNQHVLAQIDRVATERNDLLCKIFKIEHFYESNLDRFQNERYSSGRKKHNRRCANDIERKYKCPYHKCEKFYGSEGSLNLHIKIKHNGGNKTDREKIAKSIVFAKANGMILPDNLEVNLPPGSVEKAATQVGITLDNESLKQLEEKLVQKNEKTIKQLREIEMSKNMSIIQPLSQDTKKQIEDTAKYNSSIYQKLS